MKSKMLGELIEINGINIHYERVGNGPNYVLLLPGGIGTSRTDFTEQLDNGLDKSLFTMIAWDPPGYGFSRPPSRHYDKDVYKTDAETAANLMMKLGINYYSVLGWSDGAKTGLLMAIKYTSKIDKLAIFGGNAYCVPKEKLVLNKSRDINIWQAKTRQYFQAVYGDELPGLWNKHVDHYVNNLDDICKNEVKYIRCPTLILHGDLDGLPMEHPLFLLENIADSRLHRFPYGAHNIHQEYSKEFNKIVTDFLLE